MMFVAINLGKSLRISLLVCVTEIDQNGNWTMHLHVENAASAFTSHISRLWHSVLVRHRPAARTFLWVCVRACICRVSRRTLSSITQLSIRVAFQMTVNINVQIVIFHTGQDFVMHFSNVKLKKLYVKYIFHNFLIHVQIVSAVNYSSKSGS